MLGFRVWDNVDKKFTNCSYEVMNFKGEVGMMDRTTFVKNCDRFIPLQSTGLFDCDGKEIFEGDIVEKLAHRQQFSWVTVVNNVTEFFNKYYIYEIDEAPDSRYFKVLGNIYENPEFLESAKC